MGDRRHAHLSEEEIAECAAAHASRAREASHSLLSERRARSTRPPCAYLRFREIFNLVDLDKGGTISKEELKQLMNTLGLKPSQASTAHSPSARRTATVLTRRAAPRAQEELNQMVAEIDADNSGEIDFDGAPPVHRIIPHRILE